MKLIILLLLLPSLSFVQKKVKKAIKPVIIQTPKVQEYNITYRVVYQEMKDYGGTFVWEEFTVVCNSTQYTNVNLYCILTDGSPLYIPKSQVLSITEIKVPK